MAELLFFEKRDENRSYYKDTTRIHSSRVRTARLLTASQHAVGVPAWGVYLPGRGMYLPRGCTCLGGGVPARGCTCLGGVPAFGCTCLGYLSRGCTWLGGIPARGYLPGVNLPRGVPARGDVPARGYLPMYSPPVNRTTDRCKNITLPQTSFTGGKYKQKVEFSCNIARECYVTWNMSYLTVHNVISHVEEAIHA